MSELGLRTSFWNWFLSVFFPVTGPKPDTVDDMWRLIWHIKANCIVVLTNVVEDGKVRMWNSVLISELKLPEFVLRNKRCLWSVYTQSSKLLYWTAQVWEVLARQRWAVARIWWHQGQDHTGWAPCWLYHTHSAVWQRGNDLRFRDVILMFS